MNKLPPAKGRYYKNFPLLDRHHPIRFSSPEVISMRIHNLWGLLADVRDINPDSFPIADIDQYKGFGPFDIACHRTQVLKDAEGQRAFFQPAETHSLCTGQALFIPAALEHLRFVMMWGPYISLLKRRADFLEASGQAALVSVDYSIFEDEDDPRITTVLPGDGTIVLPLIVLPASLR